MTLAHIQRGAKKDAVTQSGLILAQRRRQWANISPALGQCLVFDRLHNRKRWTEMNGTLTDSNERTQVVVVNHCFTSLFGTKGLLCDIIIR